MRRALADGVRCRRAVSLRRALRRLDALDFVLDSVPVAAVECLALFAAGLLALIDLCAVVAAFFDCSVEPEVCPHEGDPKIKATANRLAASRTGAN